ncbi:DHH family phosphoesterase [Candidatus Woesearchaeota archaeon]|nr:DHH family phosphoesterase [Candidatus Woesearchaeota archaeon]
MSFFNVESFRSELLSSSAPLYFFHDDPDGLASYLILNNVKKGVGIPVKSRPVLTSVFARKVSEIGADKVFVLDIASIDDDFVKSCSASIVWLDHHDPAVVPYGVKYFNPQINGKNIPTPALCYEAFPVSLWNAVVGCFAEWFVPDFLPDFVKDFGRLLPSVWKSAGDVIYNSDVGKLIELYSFLLKGDARIVRENIRILSKIDNPIELLESSTPAANRLWKHYHVIRREYDILLSRVLKSVSDNKILLFKYETEKFSMTKDLANKLSYMFPDKFIILARLKNGEFRCSFRGSSWNVKRVLEKSLVGVRGYGGGHDVACGGAIHEDDFERFVENINREVSGKV